MNLISVYQKLTAIVNGLEGISVSGRRDVNTMDKVMQWASEARADLSVFIREQEEKEMQTEQVVELK